MNELTERDERKYSKAELLEFARKQLHEITEYCNGDALRNDIDLTDVRSVLLDYIETALQQGAQGGAEPVAWYPPEIVRLTGKAHVIWGSAKPEKVTIESAEFAPLFASPQPSPSSEGLVLVPKEPTLDMLGAGSASVVDSIRREDDTSQVAFYIYRAMLSAAPPAPAGDGKCECKAIGETLAPTTYWVIERGSPAEYFMDNHGNREGNFTSDIAKSPHWTEDGAKSHAKELEAWGVKGPLRACEHMDCTGPTRPRSLENE